MTQRGSDSDAVKQLLKEVIAEASTMDLGDVRMRRVRAVSKKRRAQLEDELALLDAILMRLIATRTSASLPVSDQAESTAQESDAPVVLESMESGQQLTLDEAIGPSDETPGTELEEALTTQKTQTLRSDTADVLEDSVSVASLAEHYRKDLIPADAPTDGWAYQDEILFDDALRLFRLGDSEGALVSLERLLLTSQLNEDLNEFISANEERLLDLYETRIGPFSKIPIRMDDGEPMPPSFYEESKVVAVLHVVDGRRSYADILSQDSLSRLEGVMVLSQLLRLGTINTEIAPH
jgi:hypothetical protein